MLARIRKSMKDRDQGFTLIELLVVMIIIGILAAIAVPVFLNQRKKAQDSATKSDVTSVGKEIAAYYVDANVTALTKLEIVGGKYVLTIGSGTGTGNTITLGTSSNNVVVDTTTSNTTLSNSSTWCVALKNTAGSDLPWRYSATGGLENKGCGAV